MLVCYRKTFTQKNSEEAKLYNRHKQEVRTITTSLFKISTFNDSLLAKEHLYIAEKLKITHVFN